MDLGHLSESDIWLSGLVLPVVAAVLYAVAAWAYLGMRRYRVARRLLTTASNLAGSVNGLSVGPLSVAVNLWFAVGEKGASGWYRTDFDLSRYRVPEYTPSPQLRELIDDTWSAAKQRGVWSNDNRWGLAELSLSAGRVGMSFWKTDYRNFIGTNRQVGATALTTLLPAGGRDLSCLLHDSAGYEFLASSGLSNDLATAMVVTTQDGYVLLSRRSGGLAVLPGVIHASVAEGTKADRDFTQESPDPFMTLRRGAREELGVDIDPDAIEVIAIGLYREWAQPFMLARYRYPGTHSQLMDQLRPVDRSAEGGLFPVKLTVDSLAPMLFDRQVWGVDMRTAELCKAALLLVLIQRYGLGQAGRMVRHALYELETYGPSS